MTSPLAPHATLLLVDDIPTNLKILLTQLHNQGFRVLVAHDGEDGLRKAHANQPDLILLDIMMPRMDGFEVCRRLKDNKETKHIPVIFMTALTDTADKIKGFNAGGVDYVTKPVQTDEVLARINTHLTLRKLQKKLAQQNEETNLFAHAMVNDLKNPLLRLSNLNVHLLQQLTQQGNEETYQLADEMQQIGANMLNIVDALLLLISVRTDSVSSQSLNMGAIVQRALQRLQPLLEKNQAELNLPSSWPDACGYEPWIEEVWLNYLSNALKYGGTPPHIDILAELDKAGQNVRFTIKDNGKGVPGNLADDLFSPRPQLDLGKTDYGIGLSMTQRMVNKCGGEVGFVNHDEGCEFFFTLPAAGLST